MCMHNAWFIFLNPESINFNTVFVCSFSLHTQALQKFVFIIKQDLDREKKGAIGTENLAKAIAEDTKIDNAHHDISDKLYYIKSMFLYLEGARCKIENALADQEGRQRSNKTITQYMRYQRDKQGLPQTILKVSISEVL